jgi:hypothetical protein
MWSKIAALITVWFLSSGTMTAPKYLDVHVRDLVADTARFSGKPVRVHGFVILAYEGTSIWVSEDDFQKDRYHNSFWLELDLERTQAEPSTDGRMGYVSGVFRAGVSGHYGFWDGKLIEIASIKRDPADKLPSRPGKTNPGFAVLFSLLCTGALIFATLVLGAQGYRLTNAKRS